jgi:nucleotide-binding universal stress UspA family protein
MVTTTSHATGSPRTLILVPLDFEEASKKALDTALELASSLNADIVALHITRPPVARPGELPASFLERLTDETHTAAERELNELVNRISNLKTILRTGDPEDVILSAIDDLKPSLVIMGTHGRRGLRRLLLGSVAEHVLVRSPVPVMTVRADPPA